MDSYSTMVRTIVKWKKVWYYGKNYGTIPKIKLWSFDLQWKKTMVLWKNNGSLVRRYMVDKLLIWRKTLSNQSINQSWYFSKL